MMEEENVKSDIAVLKNDIKYIKQMLDTNVIDFRAHMNTAQPFRDKVNSITGLKEAFDNHVIADRWGFGIIISLLIAILTKSMRVW